MSLFPELSGVPRPLAPGAILLPEFALPWEQPLLEAVAGLAAEAPFRQMRTPGGFQMSVAMTNCGALGWVSSERGYEYSPVDPVSGRPWPIIPEPFLKLARNAAEAAGYSGFEPDACLVNRYVPGAKMSLHQDRDEADFTRPIVSVSLGLPAVFLFGQERRRDPVQRIPLAHGDVVVWGGPARLFYHGVAPLKAGSHPALRECRINLTFRRAR